MSSVNSYLPNLIDHLQSDGRLRVWSLVITIFGDAVQPRGGTIAMSELQDLLGALRIESGALRTAMSRLAKEGWVKREKQGRNSFYRLSSAGKKAFIPAAERIYSAHFMPSCERLFIAIGPDAIGKLREKQIALLDGFGALALRNGVGLITEPDDKVLKQMQAAGFLLVQSTTDQLPQWVHEKLELDDLRTAYTDLLNRFAPLCETPDMVAQLSPLDAMSTRLLLVHEWRRLILKQPTLPAKLLPANWPGLDCHQLVKALYPALILRSESWWETASDQAALAHLHARFKLKT